MDSDLAWRAAQRVEEWAGEVRVNLIRLVAITAFYAHHLVNFYLLEPKPPADFHVAVTGIAVAWTLGALALHAALVRRWSPAWLKYAAVAWDALMIAVTLMVYDGTKSPLVILFFLLVATAVLRLNLRLVWASTAAAILGYLFLCGHAFWVRPDFHVPRPQQIITGIGLACAGLLAGQAVRQAKRLAQDFADRVRPDEPEPPKPTA